MFGTLSSLVLRRSSHLATVSRSSSMATASRPVLRGVIFDMDGTLTKPNLDFTEMYRQVAHPLAARGTHASRRAARSKWPRPNNNFTRPPAQAVRRRPQGGHPRRDRRHATRGACGCASGRSGDGSGGAAHPRADAWRGAAGAVARGARGANGNGDAQHGRHRRPPARDLLAACRLHHNPIPNPKPDPDPKPDTYPAP